MNYCEKFYKPKPSRNPSRQVLWARRKRDWLYKQLGGCCNKCGESDERFFQLHHAPGTKSWGDTTNVGFVRSITLYVRDFKSGLLTLLCYRCHQAEGNHGRPPADEENCPF